MSSYMFGLATPITQTSRFLFDEPAMIPGVHLTGMLRLTGVLVFCCVFPAFGQTAGTAPPDSSGQVSTEVSSSPHDVGHSALIVSPGEEAIKDKDLYDRTGYLHPFRRMVRFVGEDQRAIWMSPFHTSKSDAKYWAIFGGGTAALLIFDEKIQRNAPNPKWLVNLGTNGSLLGTWYTLVPVSAGFYFWGTKSGNDRLREAGLMSFEAMVDSAIVQEVFKAALARQRPLEGTGEGNFFKSNDRINASFPSGHAFNTFALASVFAHEYHDKLWVKIVAYGFAGGISAARLAANRHFPSDTLAGGAMGWFIGDYVYAKRHNADIDHKATVAEKVLSHVSLSFGGY